jgi:hemolysin III
MPRSIYSDGGEWSADEFASPRPIWPIRMLDQAADRAVQRHRAAACASTAAVPSNHVMTRGEKIANGVTHGLGLAVSILAFVLLVISSSLYGDAWHIVSFSVFGASMIFLYAIWALYDAWHSEEGKQLFLKLGRASAFLLIAGTYTPFMLVSLRGPWGWTLFGVVWGLCLAGVAFQFIVGNRYRLTSTVAMLFAGWMIVVAIKPLAAVLPHGGIWLLLVGGICYTVATLVANFRTVRYHYAFRNAFLIGGSTCHILAVLLFVLPQHM